MSVSTSKKVILYSDLTTANGIAYPAVSLSRIISAVAINGTNRTVAIESYNGDPVIRLKDSLTMAQVTDSNIKVRVYYLS